MRKPARIFSILFLVAVTSITFNITSISASPSTETRHFRLLAIEIEYDSCRMQSAQFLIKELLRYPNWNNSTADYVSHIHILSMYSKNEVDDEIKPFWCGHPIEANVKNEVLNFLGQAVPGEIVIFYYCGHGDNERLIVYDGMVYSRELDEWLLSGGLPQALVTVILDTCLSGSWINDGQGSVFGSRRAVMASAKSFQTSWGWCNDWSWFTYIGVIEGFQSAQDSNGDGWISAAEDFTYAKPHTESYALQFETMQNPTSYFDLTDGDIPLVQRDVTKPFPLWDVAVTDAETSTDIALAGSLVTITVVVENQGAKTWNPLVSLYCNSALAAKKTVTINPEETATLSLVWNTSRTYEGLYALSVIASVGPGETDVVDNTFADGTVKVYNAIIDIKPQNLKLKSEGSRVACFIELPPIFGIDAHEIDVSSIKLGAKVPAEALVDIKDCGNDDVRKLLVTFNRKAVVSYILSRGVDGYITGLSYEVTLRVVGRFFSGTPFEGYDTIKVTFHPPWQELK